MIRHKTFCYMFVFSTVYYLCDTPDAKMIFAFARFLGLHAMLFPRLHLRL